MMVAISGLKRMLYGIPSRSTRRLESNNWDACYVDRRCLRRYARRTAKEMRRRGQQVMWKPHWRNV